MDLAANALTTLKRVQSHLNVTDVNEASELKWLINVASETIESDCNRSFGIASHTAEAYTGTGKKQLVLLQNPVITDPVVTLDSLTVTDYTIDKASGILTRSTGWANWPSGTFFRDPVWEKQSAITVTYDAGYVLPKDDSVATPRTLPFDLEAACVMLVAQMYNQRGSEHLSSEAVGPLKWVYVGEMPAYRAIVDGYRRILL